MNDKRCRSVYGMDAMIEKDTFTPKLLEMTFSPDCNRACKYHPSFYNDILNCLYFDQNPEDCNMIRVA